MKSNIIYGKNSIVWKEIDWNLTAGPIKEISVSNVFDFDQKV
jgi:hypothetical protein